MILIDTHTHIYLPEFDDDRPEMMSRADDAGVKIFLLPAIDSTTHQAMLDTEKNFSECRAMIGLHPCSVTKEFRTEIDVIEQYLTQRKFVAIGETGLDFYWDKTFVEQQYESFRIQIRMAMKYSIPVVIHSRNATDECIDVVEEFSGATGVFHCFSGTSAQARRIIDAGFYLGIGGVVSFKNSGLDKVISEIGLDHVVLETDAPYLAPVPFRGKRNEPAYLKEIVEKLSVVCGLSVQEITTITSKNAGIIFRL